MIFKHAAVCLADDTLLDIGRRASLCEERNFEEHTASKVHTFQQFQVDVHMERELALSLKTFLLRRYLIISLNHDTLGHQFLLASAATYLLQCILCFID